MVCAWTKLDQAANHVKIATFNINNIASRLDNLLDWLAEEEPDIVCLQELKAEQGRFPAEVLEQLGYSAIWRGQRTWNGVAILARGAEPIVTRTLLPKDPDPTQARYIEAAVSGVLIASLYLPNGNPAPGPKFDYKLAWFERLIEHAATLLATGAPVVLAGDFNVVPTEADIYRNHSYGGDALLRPESRAAFQKLLDQGWIDTLKTRFPNAAPWTFWSYLRNRWLADKGLRIDHLLVSPNLSGQVVDAGVDRWVRGQDGASDHAPAWIVLDQ